MVTFLVIMFIKQNPLTFVPVQMYLCLLTVKFVVVSKEVKYDS
jgi:hypothetical protein